MVETPIKDLRPTTIDVQGKAETFKEIGVRGDVCQALQKMGIKSPFPIQEQTFKHIQDHNDVIAVAKNGTGKTLAIVLPALQNININYKGTQVIIISNTHENEDQIYSTIQKIIQNLPGESPLKKITVTLRDKRFTKEQQKQNGQIIVTTIGNLAGMVQRCKPKQIYFDEYDSYYRINSEEIIRKIMQQMIEKDIQGIWLSATPNRFANNIIRDFNISPIIVNVSEDRNMLIGLKQYFAECNEANRKIIIIQINQEELKEYIEEKTQIPCIIIRNDEERKESYDQFVQRKYRICIASDLISRGLDDRCVNLVINYDLPHSYSNYVQRCGRAGRAGHYAMALSFVTPKNKDIWLRITEIGRLTIGEDIKPLPNNLTDVDHCWEYDTDEIVF